MVGVRGRRPEGQLKAPLILACGSYPSAQSRETILHILVEGFSVLGVQVQYWMPIAVLIVTVAVIIGAWK